MLENMDKVSGTYIATNLQMSFRFIDAGNSGREEFPRGSVDGANCVGILPRVLIPAAPELGLGQNDRGWSVVVSLKFFGKFVNNAGLVISETRPPAISS